MISSYFVCCSLFRRDVRHRDLYYLVCSSRPSCVFVLSFTTTNLYTADIVLLMLLLLLTLMISRDVYDPSLPVMMKGIFVKGAV
jgi:hypothetical protein